MVIFSAIPLPLIQLTAHLLVTAWRRWKKHSAQRIHLSRRFKAAVKNIASARDFTQTQTTKEAAARDRGGSPHQWFSSPHLFYPEASHGSREGPWFNSQKGQRSTSQHREVFFSDWSQGRREGAGLAPLAPTSLWDIQVPHTVSSQLCLAAPCWHQGASTRRALCQLCFIKHHPLPPKIRYEVIKIKLAQVI